MPSCGGGGGGGAFRLVGAQTDDKLAANHVDP